MNKRSINYFLYLGVIFLCIEGCTNLGVNEDKAGDKKLSQKSASVYPRVEPYHPYGRRDYQIGQERYRVLSTHLGYDKVGQASWYGTKFHGRQTATQEIYDLHKLSAASPELPIPCFVEVTNLKNGRSVIVRVNDRGPFVKKRLIDLSYAAAVKLGFDEEGVSKVRVRGIDALAWQKNHSTRLEATPSVEMAKSEVKVVSSGSDGKSLIDSLEEPSKAKLSVGVNQSNLVVESNKSKVSSEGRKEISINDSSKAASWRVVKIPKEQPVFKSQQIQVGPLKRKKMPKN